MGESNYIFRRGLLGAALLFCITSAGHVAAQTRSFDVESGNARMTLREFARQARVSVVVDRRNVNGVLTNDVSGLLLPKQALERMLEGTPLVFNEDLETGAFAVTRSKVSVAELTTQSSEAHAPESEPKPQKTIGSRFKELLSLALESSPSLPAQDDDPDNDIFELSPFAVDARDDDGYAATETLAGTRLRTSVRDVGAAMTIMTPEFLEDVGAVNFEEALQYAPNTNEFDSGLITLPNGTNTRSMNRYNVRGFSMTALSRDFFRTIYRADMYNTERLIFSRGPNSILFGIGNPGGVSNAVSKRARFGSVREVGLRTDDHGSFRASFDFNQEVIEDQLAIRVAGLHNDQRYWQRPAFENGERAYAALKFKPLANASEGLSDLELNVTYEDGDTDSWRPTRNGPIFDGITPWIEAGRPMWDTPGGGEEEDRVNGVEGIRESTNGNFLAVSTFSPLPGASAMPTINARRTAWGEFQDLADSDGGRARSLLDESILPFDVNYLGGANSYSDEFDTFQVVLNKRILPDLHFEAAYNSQFYNRRSRDEMRGWARLMVDPNTYLPNGDLNPMAGEYYIYGAGTVNTPFNSHDLDTWRYSLSYEFDFSEHSDGWMKRLGRLRAAGSYETAEDQVYSAWGTLRNFTPAKTNEALGLTGTPNAFPANVRSGQNQVRNRMYIDAEHNIVPIVADNYPYYFAGDPIPTDQHDEYGVTPGFYASNSFNSLSITDSKTVALQHFLFDDRLITTWGWREDEQKLYDARPVMLPDRDPANGMFPDPHNYNAKDGSLLEREGTPQTFGIVGYPLPWLGLFYNESENFTPAGTARDVSGGFFPNILGEGEDYGIKLFLFDGKLSASYTQFETLSNGVASGHVRSGAGASVARQFDLTIHGNADGTVPGIWEVVAEHTGDDKYLESPYDNSTGTLFQGIMDTRSTGYEFQMTFNPSKQWRFMFNMSEQEGVLNNVASRIHDYLHEFVPSQWDNSWNAVPLDEPIDFPGGREATTLGELLARGQEDATRMQSLNGTADTRQPLKSMNLVGNYTFAPDSALKGLSLGGAARTRGDRFMGFPENPDETLDASSAYKGGSTKIFDAMIRYRLKLFDSKVDWSLQLNIRNLFDDTDLLPQSTDGLGQGKVVRWTFQEPRSYQLSSSFKF